DAIVQVFELYLKLGSLGKVVEFLRQRNELFPRRYRGQVRWLPMDPAMLHSILRNPAYCGDYIFLRRKTKKRSDGGRSVVFRSPDEQHVVRDNHELYVTREHWQRVQDMLVSRRPHKVRPLIGKGPALLQGLVRCAADGCSSRPMKTTYGDRRGVTRTPT